MRKKKVYLALASSCAFLFLISVCLIVFGFVSMFQGEYVTADGSTVYIEKPGTYKLFHEYGKLERGTSLFPQIPDVPPLAVRSSDGTSANVIITAVSESYNVRDATTRLVGEIEFPKAGAYTFTAETPSPEQVKLKVGTGFHYAPFLYGIVLLHISVFGALAFLYLSSRAKRTYLRIVS